MPRLVRVGSKRRKKKSDNNKTTPVVDDTAVLADRSDRGEKGENPISDVSIDAGMKNPKFRRRSPD